MAQIDQERYLPPEARFERLVPSYEQMTTRGDGKMELGETFAKKEIDFGSALDHLKIHHGGEVAGSQFNGEVVTGPEDVAFLIKKAIPDTLNYDQFGRAELTITLSGGSEPVGWSGVGSVEGIRGKFPDAAIEERMRIPGGIEDTVDGVQGAWYPETVRNAEGKFVVATDEKGGVKNPKAKFEPRARIAKVPKEKFRETARTDKLTVIIQKDRKSGKPAVLTVFPGENAPAYPAKIDTEAYKANSIGDTQESRYWKDHAFIEAV